MPHGEFLGSQANQHMLKILASGKDCAAHPPFKREALAVMQGHGSLMKVIKRNRSLLIAPFLKRRAQQQQDRLRGIKWHKKKRLKASANNR